MKNSQKKIRVKHILIGFLLLSGVIFISLILLVLLYFRSLDKPFPGLNSENRISSLQELPPQLVELTILAREPGFRTREKWTWSKFYVHTVKSWFRFFIDGGRSISKEELAKLPNEYNSFTFYLAKTAAFRRYTSDTARKSLSFHFATWIQFVNLETKLSDDEILLLFFNEATYGDYDSDVVGIKKVSEKYFRSDIDNKSLSFLAQLAVFSSSTSGGFDRLYSWHVPEREGKLLIIVQTQDLLLEAKNKEIISLEEYEKARKELLE